MFFCPCEFMFIFCLNFACIIYSINYFSFQLSKQTNTIKKLVTSFEKLDYIFRYNINL